MKKDPNEDVKRLLLDSYERNLKECTKLKQNENATVLKGMIKDLKDDMNLEQGLIDLFEKDSKEHPEFAFILNELIDELKEYIKNPNKHN